MRLIWGFEQYRQPAAQWHDGQFTHDAHAQSARRRAKSVGFARRRRVRLRRAFLPWQCRIALSWIVLRARKSKNKEVPMSYVDGFVVPVSRDKIDAYKALARKSGEIWKEYGAIAVVECIGDDVPYGTLTSFPRAVQAKDDEIVVFSWIVYRSRAERDQINAKVMADPRLKGDMPFDGKRLIYGGFEMWLEM
jgi:uncharacterized protein YbaA (DUF1428 family)